MILNNLLFRFFLDTTTIRLSENLPAIVGGTIGACVPVIIGIVLVLFVIRYVQIKKSYNDSNFIDLTINMFYIFVYLFKSIEVCLFLFVILDDDYFNNDN